MEGGFPEILTIEYLLKGKEKGNNYIYFDEEDNVWRTDDGEVWIYGNFPLEEKIEKNISWYSEYVMSSEKF